MNLDKSIYSEANISKKPALELLQAMGYTYLSPEECRQQRGSGYRVLLRDVLRGQLRKLNRYTYGGVENEFSAVNIEHAMDDLEIPLTDGLVRTSEKIYDALMLGKSYKVIICLANYASTLTGRTRRRTFTMSRKNLRWKAPMDSMMPARTSCFLSMEFRLR